MKIDMKYEIEFKPECDRIRWIAFFDLLGMKKMIRDKDTIFVFSVFAEAAEQMKRRVEAFDAVNYFLFSDSFLIYADDDSGRSFTEIDSVSRWFSYFLTIGGIPVRGAISCDSFYADSDSDLFFGKALVEASEYEAIQDWIGFVLCPSAVGRLTEMACPAENIRHYTCKEIPYNRRDSKLTRKLPACILGGWGTNEERNKCVESLKEMRDKYCAVGIRKKYDNTIAFIEANRRV